MTNGHDKWVRVKLYIVRTPEAVSLKYMIAHWKCEIIQVVLCTFAVHSLRSYFPFSLFSIITMFFGSTITSGMSTPRAMTSVHNNTPDSLFLNLRHQTPSCVRIICIFYYQFKLFQNISYYWKCLRKERTTVRFIINFHFPAYVLELAVNYKT